MDQKQNTTFLESMSGPLDYPLTNDYMFRALMQSSNSTLRHLLAALLDVPYEEIYSCEILNPIILGEAIDYKTCVMDIRVRMNNDRLINLEMQMYPYAAWPKRALFYLCRLYCNIERGQDYDVALPSVHIGILNESPFPEVDKFYSKYELADIEDPKRIHVFTGNFSLRVLNLSQLDNVSEEERSSEIYIWAQLFRATTWEGAVCQWHTFSADRTGGETSKCWQKKMNLFRKHLSICISLPKMKRSACNAKGEICTNVTLQAHAAMEEGQV